MKAEAVSESALALSSAGGNGVGRRDPARAMAQGILVGAAGGLGLWALVGAVIISVF